MLAETITIDPARTHCITQDCPEPLGSTDSNVWPFCVVKERHHEWISLMPHADSATISAFFVSNGRRSGLSVNGCFEHDHVPPLQAREGMGYR